MSDARLKSYVDRIEKLEEEQRTIGADKRGVYDEAAAAITGLNKKALRKIVAERRQKDRAEIEAAMEGYRIALGMVARDVAEGRMTLDQAEAESGFSRSAIHREKSHRNDNAVSGTKPRQPITPDFTFANAIAEQERIAKEAAAKAREERRQRLAALTAPATPAELNALVTDHPAFLRQRAAV